MSSFKPYAARALLIAVAASVLSIISNDVLAVLLGHDLIGFVPSYLAVSLGSVHGPSYLGFFVGFLLQWAALAVLGALAIWAVARLRRPHST